jgi:hypothetical protein
MGFSYPANAGWRLWALAKAGRADTVLDDLRSRWATMDSVKLNNTLQEDWRALPDSGAQWSHCAVAPLYVTYMSLAGLRPLQPGFKRVEIRPQLANLDQLELAAYTVLGPIRFSAEGAVGNRSLSVELPAGCEGELVLRREESVSLDRLAGAAPPKHLRYRVPGGRKTNLTLRLM